MTFPFEWAVGLLALGQYVVDFVALYLYPTSAVIRQYKERTTGDLRLVQVRWAATRGHRTRNAGPAWCGASTPALSPGKDGHG